MSHPLPRLADLAPDLLRLSRRRVVGSLLLPLGFVAGYVAAAGWGAWPLAVLAVAGLTFFTHGSVSHDLVHRTLGLSRRWNDLLLTLLEAATFRSGRAYALAHRHHHARFPHADDVEGAAAHLPWWRAAVSGLWYVPGVWVWAVRRHPADRPRLVAEAGLVLGLAACLLAASVVWRTPWPAAYVGLCVAGAWAFPLALARLPHTPDGDGPLHQTRRVRGWVARVLLADHLYHLEHHLYPAVPHHHWPELARRLDPHLDRLGVPAVRLGR